MIDNTNLKNDMTNPLSRKVMIVPPATSAQINDAEGVELKTYSVTVDGTEITEDMNLEENEVVVSQYIQGSYNYNLLSGAPNKAVGLRADTGEVNILDLKDLELTSVTDGNHTANISNNGDRTVIVGSYMYYLDFSGSAKTITIYKVDLEHGGVTLDYTYEPELAGNIKFVHIYDVTEEGISFLFNTKSSTDADFAKKIFTYDITERSVSSKYGCVVSDTPVSMWFDVYGAVQTSNADYCMALVKGDYEGKELLIAGKSVYAVDKSDRSATAIHTITATYPTYMQRAAFHYNYLKGNIIYSLTSRTTNTDQSCIIDLSSPSSNDTLIAADANSLDISKAYFTTCDDKLIAVGYPPSGLTVLAYTVEVTAEGKILVQPYKVKMLTEV